MKQTRINKSLIVLAGKCDAQYDEMHWSLKGLFKGIWSSDQHFQRMTNANIFFQFL